MSNDNSYQKKSSSDNMEVDEEPSLTLSPWTRIWEFQNKVHQFQANLEEVDFQDLSDPHKCAVYANEIHSNMKSEEMKYIVWQNYMEQQKDVNEKMWAILIDWLVEVHLKFKLVPETLYLTVNLIDRYLERVEVMWDRLQLVGVTAMLIASKYEEIYAPEV